MPCDILWAFDKHKPTKYRIHFKLMDVKLKPGKFEPANPT
jgi:hypothetical protein